MGYRIEKLTSDHEAQIEQFRDEWMAIGLCTDKADRLRAEAGADAAYEAAGLEKPTLKIWLQSPMAGAIGAQFLSQVGDQVRDQVRDQVWDQVRDQVGDQVWAQVGDQVGAQVRDQVRDQVWAQVRDQVRDQVWAQVWDQVGDQVWAQVWDQVGAQVWAQVWDQVGAQVRDQVRAQVRAQVRDQVRAQVRAQVGRAVYGQHEAGWLGFYDFFGRVTGISAAGKLRGINEIARSSGWFWPFRGAVILTERPSALHRDDRGRLHCGSGPALVYPDGFSLWRLGGVSVTESVVMNPQMQTLDEIRKEPNEELKRLRIERYAGRDEGPAAGWRRYLKEVGATVQENRRNDIDGTDEVLFRTPDGMTLFVGACRSTGRIYALEQPTEVETCEQAQNWMRSGSWLDRLKMKRRTIDAA